MSLDESKERNRKTRLANAYKRLFSSKDGKVVLADLAARYYHGAIFAGSDTETASYLLGKRDIVKEILDTTNIASNPKLFRELLEDHENE